MTNGKKGYHVGTIKKKAAGGLTADVLLVTAEYDKDLLSQAELYAKYPLKGAKIRTVETWEELATLLEEYKSIDRLVLYFHGIPGSLLVGGQEGDLSTVGGKYFKGKNLPKVGQLDLEACSVAESPEKVVPFGKLFSAEKVTAWNYYHVGMKINIDVPSDASIATIERVLKPYKGYMLENTPSAAEMAKKPGKYEIGAEWFRDDLNDDPLPAPSGEGMDPREKTFKHRSKKNEVTLGGKEDVKAYVDKYAADPVRPLDHVTLDLSGM